MSDSSTTHTLDVRQPYFDLIKSGVKTIEGRAGLVAEDRGIHENYKLRESKYKQGDTLLFTLARSTTEDTGDAGIISCTITDISFFASFEDMLSSCGLLNCLPNINTLTEGVDVYRSFPGYEQREKDFGVVGIHLRVHGKL